MLDHAANKQGTDDRIEWHQADALDLPFDNNSFDAVICQYGVMFYPDRVKGYKEAHRVLKPGGHYIFNVWDHIGENEFANVVTAAEAQVFPDDPLRFLARTPHGYHDVETIRGDLNTAGFSDISFDTKEEVSRAPSPRHPAVAYCQGTPLRSEIEARDAGSLEYVTECATKAITELFGGGPVSAKIQAHIFTAVR